MYVVDAGNSRVRAIRTTGDGVAIFTVAGSAVPGDSGDDGPATLAQLNSPSSCAVDVLGRLLIADTANARVRAVSPGGYITTAAGTGVPGFAGEGGPATAALLNSPRGLCVSPSGGFFVSDTGNDRVRFVSDSPSVGATITTFAGSGDPTFVGDGGPATAAGINGPTGVLALGGFVYIADSGHGRVRVVDASAWRCGPWVRLVHVDVWGWHAGAAPVDTRPPRFLRVARCVPRQSPLPRFVAARSAAGIITTAVGNGRDTSGGDGGPPTAASLAHPQGLGAGAAGELFIADTNGTRVRVVGRLVLVSASGTPSRTASPSPSASATLTPSSSRTGTPSPSVTLTVTPTASPSASASRPPWHTATQTPAPAGPPESGCPMASCGVPVTIGVVAAAATAAAALLCWRRGRRPGTADDADAEADIDADTEPLIGTTGTDEGVLWSVDRPVI